jgi:hypothetical protein
MKRLFFALWPDETTRQGRKMQSRATIGEAVIRRMARVRRIRRNARW